MRPATRRVHLTQLLLLPLAGGLSVPRLAAADAARKAGAPAELGVAGARIRVHFEPGAFEIGGAAILTWIGRCARAVASYYGRFPVSEVDVRLNAVSGRALRGGRVLPIREPTISMDVGVRAGRQSFERNWSMTHEMVHLALPNLARRHHWLEEGLASYIEPIARARIGWLEEAAVWREWLENLPRGLPEPGDRGLDRTPTWARTYWGGALFCFLADVEIRKATRQRKELAHALRGVLGAGGNITRRWPIQRVIEVGDKATGTPVLDTLYENMKDKPQAVALDTIWRELGVSLSDGAIQYDEQAPLAPLRRNFVRGLTSRG